MRYLFIGIIVIYQKTLSPDKGIIFKLLGRNKKTCIFYPTCSEYGKEALEKYGSLKGLWLTGKRILRCNPFNDPKVDLVP